MEEDREASLVAVISQKVDMQNNLLIFFKTKHQCHRMSLVLGCLGFNVCELHGNMP